MQLTPDVASTMVGRDHTRRRRVPRPPAQFASHIDCYFCKPTSFARTTIAAANTY